MKLKLRHIILFLLTIFMVTLNSYAQNIRYVQRNSTHALCVPENPDYNFKWSMTWGYTNIPVTINDTTNVTRNILWDMNFYDVSVYPILDSVGCLGEPIYMKVYTVEYLSLHAFNDVYYIQQDDTLQADVSRNDFDERGSKLIYNTTLIDDVKNGAVAMTVWGEFTYIPNPGFVGIDSFQYEVMNDATQSMYANAWVYIEVKEDDKIANLYIEKTGPAKALYGSQIEYVILVKNNGPDVAESVVVTDITPFGLFNPQYATGGTFQPWGGYLELGDLKVGESVIISIIADVSKFSPKKLYNQALTYSDIFDTDFRDNDSIWYTEVSALFVDLPDQLQVPGCSPVKLPNISGGNNAISSYRWRPATGLSDTTVANPIFTPDASTINGVHPYILIVTDVLGNVASDTINIYVADVPVATIELDTMVRDINETILISGSQSTGDNISYIWSTPNGHIVGSQASDTIRVDSLGIYRLTVRDLQKCEAYDSVLVIYESHPPVAVNDTVDIVAGTDSSFNVLVNDYDINGFDLRITSIKTPPNHGIYTWDAFGNIGFTPNIDYWLTDSLEYEVCNNGYPEKCSSAWVIIHCLRPPLNADVVITKTSDPIAFWDDSILYDITLYSNGPDTATFISLYDKLNVGLISPTFSYSTDNRQTWSGWDLWKGQINFASPLIPKTGVFHLKIKAYIDPRADRIIDNMAYISPASDFLENDYVSDTSRWETKIKEKVIAMAGRDRLIGACHDTIELNGSASEGENLTYRWSPALYLDDPNSSTPTFTPGETGFFTYILTVTDDDGITDADTLTINVLPPPLAKAGSDIFKKLDEDISLNGSKSSGTLLKYLWTATNGGHIVEGTQTSSRPGVDSLGTYILTVTDVAGCSNSDTVEVYQFYYPPYAIPDYYSTLINTPIVSDGVEYRSLLYNDFDPNGLFTLSAKPVTNMPTKFGGKVTIKSDGSFTYTPPPSNWTGVDDFSYQVCNPTPNGCSRGYVKITVGTLPKLCNLSIKKWVLDPTVLIGREVEYVIEITNSGTENLMNNITITDSLSAYITNPLFSYDGIVPFPSSNKWTGDMKNMTLNAGQSKRIYIRGKVSTNFSEKRLLNAAMVSSPTFDNCFDWDDKDSRNVDTTSVYVENDLIAQAELIENFDNNRKDGIIGVCDNRSILSATNSSGTLGIDEYEWQPQEYVISDSTVTTGFNLSNVSDATIIFTLIIRSGEKFKTAQVSVTISPKVSVDAGPDQKMNDGVPLVLNATGEGKNVTYVWSESLSFRNDSVLHPIINEPGVYRIYATDMHGCTAEDFVTIRVNQLFALNDILVVVSNVSQDGNVATNDYDPDGDSTFYDGIVYTGPFHGTIVGNLIGKNGAYTYKPDADYIGDDYFTYMVHDNNAPDLYVTAKVFIKVIDVDTINSPPVANHDVYFVNKNSYIESNLLANDYDFDGGSITLNINPVSKPSKGNVVLEPDGQFRYTAYSNEVGTDSFYYRISDNGNPTAWDTALVYIFIHKIEQENHKPVAVDDAYYAVVKTITGNILTNDYDPDGHTFFHDQFVTTGPFHGDITFLDNYGNFEYTPDSSFEGTDQMIYTIKEEGTIEAYTTTATVYFTSLSEKRYQTNLVVTKIGPEYVLSGETIQYTITAKDAGPTLANNVVISDTLFTGLTKLQYSEDGGVTWKIWNGTFEIDRMMLYDESEISIRAQLPDSIWAGLPDTFSVELPNTARVDHNMVESEPDNNVSTWITTVYQKVFANAGLDTMIGSCIAKYNLDASGSIGMGKLSYSWSPVTNLNNPSLINPAYTTTPGIRQKFTLTVSSDYNGLFLSDFDVDEVLVEVGNSPVANAGPEFWDQIDTVTLDGSDSWGEEPITYLWWKYDDENQQDSIGTTASVDIIKSGDYYLTITDRFGCSNTDETHVGYKYDPLVAVDDYIETPQQEQTPCIKVLRNDIIDPDDDFDLTLLMVTSQPKHGTIIENPNDSCFIYIPNQYYIGYDTFTYIVSTGFSFSDEATVVVNVLPRPAIVPEGFSPNGDNINDYLIIENIEKYEMNSIIIFNRWGNIVYQRSKYSNSEPWGGIANKGIRIGQGPVPAGVYLYILDLGDDEITREINGVEVNNRIKKGNIYVAADRR